MTKQNAINDIELDKVENLDDLENRETALTNLGFGDASVRLITDADFSGGFLTLTNPCAQYFVVDVVTPGLVIKLPPAQDTPSYIAFGLINGPNIINVSSTISFDIQLSDGTFLVTATPGVAGDILLIDNSTVPGTWVLKPFVIIVNGHTGIVNLTGQDIFPNGQMFDNFSNLSEDWWARGLFWHDGTTQVLDWENQTTFDQSGIQSLEWNNRQLYDSTPNLSLDWQNRRLYLNDGATLILDYQNQWLYDSVGNPSIHWDSREAFDEFGEQSITWFNGSRFLKDNSSVTSVDWGNRALYANNGTSVVVDWDGQQLIDTAGFGALFWGTGGRQLIDDAGNLAANFSVASRQLFDSTGLNISIDWDNRQLIDEAGALAINYTAAFRQLYDISSNLSMDFGNRNLYDNSGVNVSINYQSKQLLSNGTLSHDWNTRQLFANNGTTVAIDYSDINQIIFSTFQGTEFAVVPGAAPVVNYFTVNGAPTLNTPILNSVGSDPDVGMTFQVQGAGNYGFTSTGNGGLLELIQPGGAIANSFVMFVANTGNAPAFAVAGSDTDVSMQLQAQGSGVIFSNNPISGFAGFRSSEAANGKQGVATLVAGTVTVSNTSITANSRIMLTAQDNNTVGSLRISARTVSTDFTITSSLNTDTGVVAYEIFEPA